MRLCSLLLTVSLFAGACASAGDPAFRQTIGNASTTDAYESSIKIIERFHYEVLQDDTDSRNLRIETHWSSRPPFEDEAALGITRAESRLIVEGRARGHRSAGGVEGAEAPSPHFAVRIAVDNRVQTADNPDWTETVSTPMFRAYAESIAEEFANELNKSGVRR